MENKNISNIKINYKEYKYYDLNSAAKEFGIDIAKLPYSLKILLENTLRFHDYNGNDSDIKAFAIWLENKKNPEEIAFRPARVLMQDFTGVPAVVDLCAMRDAMNDLGGDATKINPLARVDLVIDHSVQVDFYATPDASAKNVALEMERNIERYELLRSAQKMFKNFRTVPPGTGICHQVNIEYLADVVSQDAEGFIFPDTVVGTDSHTTMVNGLAVLGWGVGGIEAESAMLGQPISLVLPEVIGCKLTGKIKEGVTATDIVLTITNILRAKGVVEKFVEFYGSGLDYLTLADRATIANMAPEYGATCGFFPIDVETIKYLNLTAREEHKIALIEAYAKAQGLWRDNNIEPIFSDIVTLDLSTVEPCLSGPKRPQDKVILPNVAENFKTNFDKNLDLNTEFLVENKDFSLKNANVLIAAITSCTNTSNPQVMIAAGLVAKKALALGLKVKPWVKTSLAPGSQVVSEYLDKSGLTNPLNELGFNIVGFGCTTCIGNSGPFDPKIEKTIKDNNLVVAAVLSGNRNFEGRVHQQVKANYLASPPLVVAYALAGTMNIDLSKDPIGTGDNGNKIYLKDIWPSTQEISDIVANFVTREMFKEKYKDVFTGDKSWQNIKTEDAQTYNWSDSSTYIKKPPYFANMRPNPTKVNDIVKANILALLGDSITTDHISPAGSIAKNTPAAKFLEEHGVKAGDFNSYGARRGNDDIMTRGTFANIRIKNEMAPGTEGGVTTYVKTKETLSIFDAAQKYKADNIPLIIIAGKDYGMGSSRDWAAKGTLLLGVKAVIAESFERIHRSNLVGMGILPLTFKDGVTRKTLNLTGYETIDIIDLQTITPRCELNCKITYPDGNIKIISLLCRIDTENELEYYKNGGILQHVIRKFNNGEVIKKNNCKFSLKTSFKCPVCNNEYKLLKLVAGFNALFYRCPKCSSFLKAKNISKLVLIMTGVFGLTAVLSLQYQMMTTHKMNLLIPIMIIILYNIVLGLLVCNKADITVVKDRQKK